MSTLTSRMQAVQSPLIPIIRELIRSNPGTIFLGQGVVRVRTPAPKSAGKVQHLRIASTQAQP